MSKIENNKIYYYDAYNEIRCDKFALEKFVKESEEKDKTIADLEAKLAVSENTITNLIEDNRASQEWYKKQLAESESRFQAHKQNDARIIQDQTDLIENLRQQLAEKDKEITQRLVIQERDYNQDKISFCIEQFEKVKEFANNEKSYDFMTEIVYLDELLKQIDNQIKAIKGEE